MDNDFTQGTARQRYSKLKQHREHFLDRAEECSELTIPSLIQPDGFTDSSDLYNPFQSVGARGVNNLASKFYYYYFPQTHHSLDYLLQVKQKKIYNKEQN